MAFLRAEKKASGIYLRIIESYKLYQIYFEDSHQKNDGESIQLNLQAIENDAKYDGFKALSTTTDLPVETILSKYRDLFELEHTFRALKSQREIRPVFHWTDKRITGHIVWFSWSLYDQTPIVVL